MHVLLDLLNFDPITNLITRYRAPQTRLNITLGHLKRYTNTHSPRFLLVPSLGLSLKVVPKEETILANVCYTR